MRRVLCAMAVCSEVALSGSGSTLSGVFTVIGEESLGFVNQFPPNCAAAGYGSQRPAFDGEIVINDAN